MNQMEKDMKVNGHLMIKQEQDFGFMKMGQYILDHY